MRFGALAHTVKRKLQSALSLETKRTLPRPMRRYWRSSAPHLQFRVLPSIRQTAMGVPAVAAAVTLISDAIGTLPAKNLRPC